VLDHAECERARMACDPAYDGRFFTGVRTTGVYCRPVCPVRPAHPRNVCFYPPKRLLDEGGRPMTEIALLAGFHSLRRFNAVFAEVYGRAPSKITRGGRGGSDGSRSGRAKLRRRI
jgi:methylphosphotriester-DNA--protein-cysteine methyltransferase